MTFSPIGSRICRPPSRRSPALNLLSILLSDDTPVPHAWHYQKASRKFVAALFFGIALALVPVTGQAQTSKDQCDAAWLGHQWPNVAVMCASASSAYEDSAVEHMAQYNAALEMHAAAFDGDRELAFLDFTLAAMNQGRKAYAYYKLHDQVSAESARKDALRLLDEAVKYAAADDQINLPRYVGELKSQVLFKQKQPIRFLRW